jgi:hypothetical protein
MNYGKDAVHDCKPRGYDPNEFGALMTITKTPRENPVDAQKMLDYGKPQQKYMLNWPNYGNDTYLNIVEMNPAQRLKELESKQT